MKPDEDPRWHDVLNAMRQSAKSAPDNPELTIAAIQGLADVIVQLGDSMTDEQAGMLVGVGALMWREAEREASAKVQTLVALGKIRPIQRGGA